MPKHLNKRAKRTKKFGRVCNTFRSQELMSTNHLRMEIPLIFGVDRFAIALIINRLILTTPACHLYVFFSYLTILT